MKNVWRTYRLLKSNCVNCPDYCFEELFAGLIRSQLGEDVAFLQLQ